MQILSNGDSLHEMSKSVSVKNKKNLSKSCLLKFLPRVLNINMLTIISHYCHLSEKGRKETEELEKRNSGEPEKALDSAETKEIQVLTYKTMYSCSHLLQVQQTLTTTIPPSVVSDQDQHCLQQIQDL